MEKVKNSTCTKQKIMEDNIIDYIWENSAKFEGIEKEHIEDALKDEELKHDTVITREQLELLEKHGIKLAPHL
jgi:hypothetical protein